MNKMNFGNEAVKVYLKTQLPQNVNRVKLKKKLWIMNGSPGLIIQMAMVFSIIPTAFSSFSEKSH